MLLISMRVLCLEDLSYTLWACWVFDVGESSIVVFNCLKIHLKCESYWKDASGQLRSQDKDKEGTFFLNVTTG